MIVSLLPPSLFEVVSEQPTLQIIMRQKLTHTITERYTTIFIMLFAFVMITENT